MIVVSNDKAIEIAKAKIRAWRDDQFNINDVNIQNALVDGVDASEFITRRDYLRDLPSTCENKSIDELKTLLVELGLV